MSGCPFSPEARAAIIARTAVTAGVGVAFLATITGNKYIACAAIATAGYALYSVYDSYNPFGATPETQPAGAVSDDDSQGTGGEW